MLTSTARQIYIDRKNGMKVAEIAAKYGVSDDTVNRIVKQFAAGATTLRDRDVRIQCDSANQLFLQREDTRIGISKINLCRYCSCRTSPHTCPRFWDCYDHRRDDGFPYNLPWTEWMNEPASYDRESDPYYRYDPITGYLRPEFSD